MTNFTIYISSASLVFAATSALLWALSARVKFQFGFDMEAELNTSMNKASSLNAWAATFTALATLGQAAVMFIDVYSKATGTS